MNNPIRSQWNGKFRALVIDDRDPLFKGRVKVRIPDLMVSDIQHVGEWGKNGLWASPANNYLGGRSIQDTKIRFKEGKDAWYQGSCLIPPKGSHVWVWFEKNDVSHPFYGAAAEYGDCQTLPENQLGKEYQKKWTLLKTREGRTIIASDDPSDCRFEITGKKRKMKNEPFGDIQSVYPIKDNQSTFLIDERDNHEKILLGDYKGNFVKLIQNEIDSAGKLHSDELHVKVANEMHIECGSNFYLWVGGDMHIKVKGSLYVTALSNIFAKAYEKWQEMAQSFDRSSMIYDRNQTTYFSAAASVDMSMQAGNSIYQTSRSNARNAVAISDAAANSASYMAGGFASLIASGTVVIYGANATSIQTKPINLPIGGSVSYPTQCSDAMEPRCDGERYDKIELSDGAPILTTPVGSTAMTPCDVNHSKVNTSQPAESHVGDKDTSSSSNQSADNSNSNSSTCCGGGNKFPSDNNSQNNSTNSDSGGSSGVNLFDWLKSITGNYTYQYSNLDEDFVETKSNYRYYSVSQIKAGIASLSIELSEVLHSRIYSYIAGSDITVKNYDIDKRWNTLFDIGQLDCDEDWVNDLRCTNDNLTNALILKKEYQSHISKDFINDICDNLEKDYQFLTTNFIDTVKGDSSNLPYKLETYREIVNDKIFTCLEDVIDARSKGENISDVIHTNVGDMSYSICSALITIMLGTADDIISSYIDNENDIVDKSINENDEKFIQTVVDFSNDQFNESRDDLESKVEESSKIDSVIDIISEYQLSTVISSIKNDIRQLVNDIQDITKYVDDPDNLDKLISDIIKKSVDDIDNKKLNSTDRDKALENLRDDINYNIHESLNSLFKDSNIDKSMFNDLYDCVKKEFESNSYDVISKYSSYKNELCDVYSNKLTQYIENSCRDLIDDIEKYSKEHSFSDAKTSKDLKDKIINLFNNIQDKLSDSAVIDAIKSEQDIDDLAKNLKNDINQTYASKDNENISNKIDNLISDRLNNIETSRRSTVTDKFILIDNVNNQFNKFDTNKYQTPKMVGCGYDNILFLNDKYRKTIVPLIFNSGANVIAFTLIKNTADIEENANFIDNECIKEYNMMFDNISVIDTRTKWWSNLKEILDQCSILNITAVITIMDFNDDMNPFIVNKNENIIYCDKNWDDDTQGKFLKTLFEFVKTCNCQPIYNIGYGSYKKKTDINNVAYPIYPTCGYLRKLINWCVYQCDVSSNYICLTSNKGDNLYYYNPYSEWHSFDDNIQHYLGEHDILVRDTIDNKTNDNAEIVTFDNQGKMSGGYAGYLTKCDKHSIAIFSMRNLTEKLDSGTKIFDPNIMNDIFCKNSRNAIRYFKTQNYFESDGRTEFDINGDVK